MTGEQLAVVCQGCGHTLPPEEPGRPREPCPECDETRRALSVELHETVHISDSLSAVHEFVADEIVRHPWRLPVFLAANVLSVLIGLVLPPIVAIPLGVFLAVVLFMLSEVGGRIVRRYL